MIPTRPRSERGTFAHPPEVYGHSALGAPLELWRPRERCQVLVFAGIHGDEPESTVVLSTALRQRAEPPLHCAVILAANPDGLRRGTRGNARGVDLNRNFPSANWSPEPVCYRASADEPRDVVLSPGSEPGSEPEIQALLALVAELRPLMAVAIHAPLATIEDPERSGLGQWLSERSGLPLVDSVGYETPGSFGSWSADSDIHEITYELPIASSEQLVREHSPIFAELLARPDL